MTFDRQPQLHDQTVRLEPLRAGDFEALYAVASDPLIWEQHPNRLRWQRDVFTTFFRGAVESGGALCVFEQGTSELLGSSRYYDWDESNRSVAIGYTFIARHAWGRGINRAVKALMLAHAFESADQVIFHVGVDNTRSRRAMEKLGGILLRTESMAYYGEPSRENAVYGIKRTDWAG